MKKTETPEMPRVYLSTSGGKWRVIVREMPICADQATRAAAVRIAHMVNLARVTDLPVWDGDAGVFIDGKDRR